MDGGGFAAAEIAGYAEPGAAAYSKKLFFGALALVTALPLFGLGFGLWLVQPSAPHPHALLIGLAPIIAATGYGHVAATAWVYVDRGFWQLLARNWQRFLALPAALVALAVGATWFSPHTTWALNTSFVVWQLYHYQRQNYGVIAFAAQDRRLGALPKSVQIMLDLSVAGGICEMLSHADFLGLPILRFFGAAFFVASSGALVHALFSSKRIMSDPLVLLFTLLSWAFFLPSALTADMMISFTSYAIAHGAQYLIFIMVLSRGSALKVLGPIAMVVVTFVTYVLFTNLFSTSTGAAVYTGLVMGHFMIDAKFWRMREPMQRGLIKQRFAFLFS